MLKFLKNFGLGLLYVLLFPFILLGVVVFAIIGFVRSILEVIFIIVRFVRGEKIFPPYPEDVKAQEILAKNYGLKEEKEEAPAQPATQNVYVQQNYYPNPNGQMMPGQNPAFGQPPYQQMPPYGGQPYQQQNPYLGQEPAPQRLPNQDENPYRTNLNMHRIGSNPTAEPAPALLENPEEDDPFSAEEYKQGGEDDE